MDELWGLALLAVVINYLNHNWLKWAFLRMIEVEK
jgi:hypothetical protein